MGKSHLTQAFAVLDELVEVAKELQFLGLGSQLGLFGKRELLNVPTSLTNLGSVPLGEES